jgi:hypothetical protein
MIKINWTKKGRDFISKEERLGIRIINPSKVYLFVQSDYDKHVNYRHRFISLRGAFTGAHYLVNKRSEAREKA